MELFDFEHIIKNQDVLDLINQKDRVAPLVDRFFTIDSLTQKAASKTFSQEKRKVLVDVIRQQYDDIELSDLTQRNIDRLAELDTYTVTTGHQLCLLGGPLYFFYKIFSTIQLAKQLNEKGVKTVPIFWMASEDHDFDEIASVNLFGTSHTYSNSKGGAVGRLKLEGIISFLEPIFEKLGDRETAEELKQLLKQCYQPEFTLSHATRLLVNQLLGKYGIVCLDADHNNLKSLFVPYIEKELEQNILFNHINETTKDWSHVQVTPREINLFYLSEGKRERLVHANEGFELADDSKAWSKEELWKEMAAHPENFSPNAVMRPVYQEVILPNLAYIGGPGELAYWLELKSSFEAFGVEMPVLVMRDSILLLDQNTQKRMGKLSIDTSDLFKNEAELIKEKVVEGAEISFNAEYQEFLTSVSSKLTQLGEVEEGLEKYSRAEIQKFKNTLEQIEKKFVRAMKKKDEVKVNQIKALLHKIFPNGSFQERVDSFIPLYLSQGDAFFDVLQGASNPQRSSIKVLEI